MTDTGQIPGEGQPESAGMVEQPGASAHGGAYTYLSEAPAEDEDLLLPGAQGAWGNEVPPPAPEPVVEAVHEPGPHETAGRDSGSVDLNGVRLPSAPASVPPSPILSAPHDPVAAAQPPRRPLHLGPPIPDASASPVRSLADRGPAGAPVRQPGPAPAGPEYLDAQPLRDMAPQNAAPWGAAPAVAQVGAEAPAAETVSPAGAQPVAEAPDAAQATMARLVIQAAAQAPAEEAAAIQQQAQDVHAHDGTQAAHGHDGVYAAQGVPGQTPGPVQAPAGPEAAAAAPVGHGLPGEQPAEAVTGHAPEGPDAAAPATGAEAPAGAEAVPQADVAAPAPEAATAPADATAQAVDAAPVEVTDGTGEVAAVVGTGQQAAEGQPVAPVEAPEAAHAAAEAAHPGPDVRAAVELPDAAQQAESAQQTEEVHPAEQAQAPEPVQQAEPVQQGDAVQQAEPVQAPEFALPAEGVQIADAPQPVAPAADDEVAAQVRPQAEGVEAAAQDAAGLAAADQAAAAPEARNVTDPGAAHNVPGAAEAVPAAAPDAAALVPDQIPVAQVQPAAPAAAPESVVPAAEPVAAHGPVVAQPAPEAAAPAQDAVQAPLADGFPPAPGNVPPQSQEPQIQEPQIQGPQAQDPQVIAPAAHGGEAAPAGPQQQAPAGTDQPAHVAPVPTGPQLRNAAVAPETAAVPGAEEAPAVPGAPAGTDPAAQIPQPAAADAEPLPSGVPLQAHPEQPLGQFVPVEGQVPTTPHLAPTPPHPLVLPVQEQEAQATVPAPREAEPVAAQAVPAGEPGPDVVQRADDLETRAADQEEDTAAAPSDDETLSAEAAPDEAARSAGPAAPAYDDAEREAVLKVMRERRDIRNGFRSDPIPHEVLLRVLEAAHTAPSVGHSQPWDFVVIRSEDTRRTMHELATRQREAYAKSLPKGRAKQFKELKIEAILDTPVNIVVTADPTRGGRHTLGRYTQPQMAPYSAALAVENLWLAARAEGLGVGWVSFFDEREMVRALGLPEHLEVIAYLCVGYVDEFPDEPELMQAGWSKRRPLSWVVHEETYGRRALPGEEPHDLLAETVAQIRPLDAKALGEAWERQKRMTKPAGALGMLEIISAQLSGLSRQCPPPIPEPAAVAIFAGDHGVHAQGVTPWPQEVTAQMVANFLGGGAVCNAFATQVGAEVCVVDVGVAADLPATPGLLPRKIRGGTSDMTTGPAMTREEAKAAIEVGIETARDLVAAGNKALLTGEMGIANTTASAALISVFTGADPAEVTGRGTGINDETLARKTEVVRRALDFHQPDPADPIGVLAAIGGFEHAALVGLLLGGASLRTPVILDGVSAGAAALVARAIAPEVLAACIAGHRSAEPGHVAALNKLGLRPLVDLDLRLGEGTGALLALPLVQSTARAMHEVATFDSAGVTEK
ncbi:nicotinate-nucleotide--dimethylbenzimidazole phosphoribosyltransferase [Streptomyces collinus]|uniref:nicotinate-nucleotide--dimethylbenzimidazole phosphoribosyltransferase n=1 Tax=Streptomyces collinus TaxID=42684 RepID=UPI00367AFA93